MKTRYIITVLLIFQSIVLWGQNKVSGRISDKSGYEVIGASVMLEGTSIGITSDISGNYSLDLSQTQLENGNLVISCIGFKIKGFTPIANSPTYLAPSSISNTSLTFLMKRAYIFP